MSEDILDSLITDARIEGRRLPLKRPYALSFVTLEHFDALLLHLTLKSGHTSMGEVVPLPGYASETAQSIAAAVEAALPGVKGSSVRDALDVSSGLCARMPFAASLLSSALEHLVIDNEIEAESHSPVPLVYAVSSEDTDLAQRLEHAVKLGFETVKTKIGARPQADLMALRVLETNLPTTVKLRFDANQAYTVRDARTFLDKAASVLGDRIELVEQLLPPEAWDDMTTLCRESSVPLMLDESIVSSGDIAHAADVGCSWIKLKLCKQGSISSLLRAAEHAVSLGLNVTHGNGVATDIANLLELRVYDRHRELFTGACEATGFMKLKEPVGQYNLRLENGSAVW